MLSFQLSSKSVCPRDSGLRLQYLSSISVSLFISNVSLLQKAVTEHETYLLKLDVGRENKSCNI